VITLHPDLESTAAFSRSQTSHLIGPGSHRSSTETYQFSLLFAGQTHFLPYWGHSPIEYAVEIAQRAAVKRLVIIHHDPLRRDSEIDDISKKLCRGQPEKGLEIIFAWEGMTLKV